MIEALLAVALLASAGVGYRRAVITVDHHEQAVVEVDGDIHETLDPGRHIVRPVGRSIHFYDRRVQSVETEAFVAGERRRVAVNWEITSVEPLHETGEDPEEIVERAIGSEGETPTDGDLARRVNQAIRLWGTVVGVKLLGED